MAYFSTVVTGLVFNRRQQMSTDVVRFTGGKTRIASFSPSDFQAIGGGYLGSHQGTWMKRKTVVVDAPLPPSRTMRRQVYHGDSHYLEGPITTGGQTDGFTTIRIPSGLEVLSALAVDHGLRLTESAPGKAAEHLIRAAGQHLSMFAAPGVVETLSELTRGRNVSIVKRRLNQFLGDPQPDESSDRYLALLDRLDRGLGSPDAEELSYPTFDRIRHLLRMRRDAAQQWVSWAMAGGLVLRGVEANCTRCGQKQWRPLSEAIPSLMCHACGCTIDSPHGYNQINYRYRATYSALVVVQRSAWTVRLPPILLVADKRMSLHCAIDTVDAREDASRSSALWHILSK